MPKKIEEKIHILSPSRAYIAPAKVMGPIVHPLLVDKSVAVKILMSGAELYEYIPKTKKTLKLTLGNINDPNRYDVLNETKNTETKITPVEPVTKSGVPIINKSDIPEKDSVEEETEENPTEVSTIDNLVFEYNEDGTVNESKIPWSTYSKNQRKAIRARINEYNASITSK